jgi:hypothetical protein
VRVGLDIVEGDEANVEELLGLEAGVGIDCVAQEVGLGVHGVSVGLEGGQGEGGAAAAGLEVEGGTYIEGWRGVAGD